MPDDNQLMMGFLRSTDRLSNDGIAIARSLRTPEAFATVFDRHFAVVHRYLARRAGSETADELAAQTFTLAFAHRDRYKDDLGTARPWLLGIATNLLLAEHRTERRRSTALERLGNEAFPSSGAFVPDRSSDERDLGAALAALHPTQREALLLHVWGDLSYAQVAAALDVPIGTVRSRISRACAALRATLDPSAPLPRARPAREGNIDERKSHARAT